MREKTLTEGFICIRNNWTLISKVHGRTVYWNYAKNPSIPVCAPAHAEKIVVYDNTGCERIIPLDNQRPNYAKIQDAWEYRVAFCIQMSEFKEKKGGIK